MKRKKQIIRAVSGLLLTLLLAVSANAQSLIPGGNTIGMKVALDGLLVASVDRDSAAEAAGLRTGDLLQKIGNVPLENTQMLLDAVAEGKPLAVTVRSGASVRRVLVQPTEKDGAYRLGASVRDHVAGIGTVSFYDPESGSFGALGHGICDSGGMFLLPIRDGIVIPSAVSGVVKGVSGTAGQLQGEFEPGRILGAIRENTSAGVFGSMDAPEKERIPVASAEEVHTGPAVIYANVSGTEVRQYAVEIVRIYENAANNRDLLVRITDPALLEVTGGIVQGMSGSPILQDGKLAGAVTHVLLNTPELGYGIFMENMLKTAGGDYDEISADS